MIVYHSFRFAIRKRKWCGPCCCLFHVFRALTFDALGAKEWNVMGTETNTLHILNIDLAIENKHKRNKLNIL